MDVHPKMVTVIAISHFIDWLGRRVRELNRSQETAD